MRQILTLVLMGALISCFSVSIVAQDADKKDERKTETATELNLSGNARDGLDTDLFKDYKNTKY